MGHAEQRKILSEKLCDSCLLPKAWDSRNLSQINVIYLLQIYCPQSVSYCTSEAPRDRQFLQLVSREFVQLKNLSRGSEKDLRSVVDGPRLKVQDVVLAVRACHFPKFIGTC